MMPPESITALLVPLQPRCLEAMKQVLRLKTEQLLTLEFSDRSYWSTHHARSAPSDFVGGGRFGFCFCFFFGVRIDSWP